ncbi:GNAT family N-acetyltransferase [Neobacillus mesonae]|nr:GNAT family N-acetyltransferase [Neobacillus mesonae]
MIREAEKMDRDQLHDLYRMLVPNSKKMNVLEDQIEAIRKSPMNFLFVYAEGETILGTLTLNICLQAMHGLRPYGIIENVIVHENYRSRNIGQKLLQHAEKYCISMDCHKIMLLSSAKRIRAHEFFEKEGFDGTVSRGFKKYL